MPLLTEYHPTLNKHCLAYAKDIAPQNVDESRLAWLLAEITENYGYPTEWLGSRIKPLDAQEQGDNITVLGVHTDNGIPFLIAVLTGAGKVKQGLSCLRERLLASEFTVVGFVTDGSLEGTKYVRKKIKSRELDFIPDLEIYRSPLSRAKSSVYGGMSGSANEGQRFRPLEPLTSKVENVFFEAHSQIRDIDGLHADEALDELSKVLYAKLYDEESRKGDTPYRAQRWIYGNTQECSTAMRVLYQEANEYDMRAFSLRIPGYKRSRGVFNHPITLSSASLAKVTETFERFDISGSELDVKGRAFQKVFQPALRAGMGQYFTPVPVVNFIVEILSPKASELILDPFSGSGHFLSTSLVFVKKHEKRKNLVDEFAFHKLHGIEKSERMARIAMTDMRLHGDGHSNVRCTDALLPFENYSDLEPGTFDIVMTNPPFGSLLGNDALDQLGPFELREGTKRVPLELLGLERCIQFLRPGGRLGIVLPESIFVNSSSSGVRDWIRSQLCIRAIISLPVETFAPFGANIKTSILFGRKWLPGEEKDREYLSFMGLIENVGYDTTGREKNGIDVDELAKELRAFLVKEGW